ncbi:MAG: hypothetical protein ACD_21C00285G0009 [uncultured bacterium]|nr:MAG: hypothetical protein ACD_21C00285G0009 [uncultured bacterium]
MNKDLLNLNNVGLRLTGLAQPILNNINYSIHAGDFIVLLGHNGSGKSSLLKILDRRYRATQGHVFLQGKDLKTYSHQQLAKKIITLTQNHQESLFASLTVLENCILVKQSHENNLLRISTTKERAFFIDYLHEFNQDLTKKLDIPVINLSGGEQQALILALSILYPPKILLLDEHTSALDPRAAARLMEITSKVIRKHSITCILSTHDLDLALNYGDRILALANGEIAQCIESKQKNQLRTEDLLKICY